jgi:hypothetical protein
MYNTRLLFTPCGGISTIAGFLPRSSSAVILEYYDYSHNKSTCMECYAWSDLNSFHLFSYGVTREEFVLPEGETRTYNSRNFGAYVLNVSRVADYIQQVWNVYPHEEQGQV